MHRPLKQDVHHKPFQNILTILGVPQENKRNQRLECSHCFSPSSWRLHERDSKARIPCVVYCHCNSGSRRDAEEATMYLLSKGISVFCLDFAVSILSYSIALYSRHASVSSSSSMSGAATCPAPIAC